MRENKYLMESDDEILRLELKTVANVVETQALWAGLKSGMHVADIGCGSGKTTAILNDLAQPGGRAVGIDASEKRINHAKGKYGPAGIAFEHRNVLEPLDDLGRFDFVWVRFFLEYFRSQGFELVRSISNILKPGGIMCLIDLDYNCLNHYGLSEKLERTLFSIVNTLEKEADFDPYMGRKLYSFLYDLGFQDINVEITSHHLIFGELKEVDAFNWLKKIEIASKKINYQFEEYAGGYEEFLVEFRKFFTDPRRLTYSPIISCRGRKPVA